MTRALTAAASATCIMGAFTSDVALQATILFLVGLIAFVGVLFWEDWG